MKVGEMSNSYSRAKFRFDSEEEVLAAALGIVAKRHNAIHEDRRLCNHPATAETVCKMLLANELNEAFGVLFMDNKNRIISMEIMFRGTINACTIPPRPIVQRSLELNAAAVILTHNHPSGDLTPSHADKNMTAHLKTILGHVDIKVLDHVIVAGMNSVSMANTGDM